MIKHNFILGLYLGIIFDVSYVVYGVLRREVIDCDNNVCYKGFKEEIKRLSDLYNKTPTVSNIPPTTDDIIILINKTENIILTIPDLSDVKNKSQSTNDTISRGSKKLENLKNIVNDIHLINAKLNDLKRKKDIHNNAFNECDGADKLYKTLRDDVANIKKIGNEIITPLDVSKRVDEIKRKSFNIKKNLADLKLPETVFQNYICNSKLQATIQDIIDSMRKIASILQTSFNGIIKSKLKEIGDDISRDAQNIKDIEKSLEQEIPTTDVKITDETRPTLDELRNKINDLKNKLKEIKVDKPIEDLLENARRQLQDLKREYEDILNFMFSQRNKEKVKEEIATAKETLRLMEEKEALKIELEDIKKVVKTLKEREICFINETVSVEDKIMLP